MRWCLIFAVTLGLSVLDAVSFAQQPGGRGQGEAQRLASARSASGYLEHRDAGYFATTGVVRFQLIAGRLQLDAPRHRKGSQSRDQDGIYESITVTAQRGIPSVHYVCQTEVQHLTLNVENAKSLRVESFLPATGERAVLEQPAQGPLTWTIRRSDLDDVCSGATLLHLHQCDAVGLDLHCGGLFLRLLQEQSLEQLVSETTVAIMSQLTDADAFAADRDDVLDCVARLRSPRRSVRLAASQQLLKWGTPIIPIVRSIPERDLAPEQHDRLQCVLRQLTPVESDTPRSLATMLINDQDHWQSLAPQLSDSQLLSANQHLSRVGLAALPVSNQAIEQIAQGATRRK
ncbi:MAG: hypothetical protein WBD20_18480 [Pirellulaceae bacterium]